MHLYFGIVLSPCLEHFFFCVKHWIISKESLFPPSFLLKYDMTPKVCFLGFCFFLKEAQPRDLHKCALHLFELITSCIDIH